MTDIFNDPTVNTENVLRFPQRTKAPAPHPRFSHPLYLMVASLSPQQQFDFLLDNLYKEPADAPDIASEHASLNLAMYGGWLLAEILLPAAEAMPVLNDIFGETIALTKAASADIAERLSNVAPSSAS